MAQLPEGPVEPLVARFVDAGGVGIAAVCAVLTGLFAAAAALSVGSRQRPAVEPSGSGN